MADEKRRRSYYANMPRHRNDFYHNMTGTPVPQGFGTLPEELDTRENTEASAADLGYDPRDDFVGNRRDSLLRPPSGSGSGGGSGGGGGGGHRHQCMGTRMHTSASASSPLSTASVSREAQV